MDDIRTSVRTELGTARCLHTYLGMSDNGLLAVTISLSVALAIATVVVLVIGR